MRLEFTSAARADLDEIGHYIALDAPRRAITFTLELRQACIDLLAFPDKFGVVHDLVELGVRACPVGAYRVFYRAAHEEVLIIRVLHSSREYGRLISG